MISLEQKLQSLRENSKGRKIRIMIMGLGSVGHYLLDYLCSGHLDDIEIIAVGRNEEKMRSDINIVRVSALIRHQIRSNVRCYSGVDFESVESIRRCLAECEPDIIVNSSRAYPGLKYGSISWKNFRAYGIWTPLSIKFVKNIMAAYDGCGCRAVVINTSYSDAVIPWMKSAGKTYPDFGSGNINHLIPRIKYAISEIKGIDDYWNIDVTMAVSHFHDVVISKEGQTEGVDPLIVSKYKGKTIDVDYKDVYSRCSISMPVDGKRNMMNASSDYEIIKSIIECVRENKRVKLHIPGAFGMIGGYPVILDGTSEKIRAFVDESDFKLEDMNKVNSRSIYLDGIEGVDSGTLTYSDELIEKVRSRYGIDLPKKVEYGRIDDVAEYLIENVIQKS